MGQTTTQIAEGRAHTDASLIAERASSETAGPGSAQALRQTLDDLIDRDRAYADRRLHKFRAASDVMVADERFASSAPDGTMSRERESADARQRIERGMADAALGKERIRSDAALEMDRSEHDAMVMDQAVCRKETNEQLSIERRASDSTNTALSVTRHELATARSEQGRHRDVLAMVSHDVRTPLAVISLNAEIISAGDSSGVTRNRADAILRSAVRIERLLTDLLDLARIESGTLKIVRRAHDVFELLQEIQQTYEPMFLARGISFTVEMKQATTTVFFDQDRIVQVLSNLLSNAMKFTGDPGAVVLRVRRLDAELLFEVRDTGHGIAPAALPHVFEKFWQLDDDSRRGLGLGLHICDQIVRAHKGAIWAESELGEGATFRFTLPLR